MLGKAVTASVLCLLITGAANAATVAAAPFVNATGRSDLDPLCYGLPDLLSEVLGTATNLHVVDRVSIDAVVAEQGLSFAEAGSFGSGVRLGKLLRAESILTGSFVQPHASGIRIIVQVIDVNSAAIRETLTREGAIAELIALCRELAVAVTGTLQEKPSGLGAFAIDTSPVANLHVMRGLNHYWQNDYMLAVASFMRARAIHPRHRDAVLWTARAYVSSGKWAHGFLELSRFAEAFPGDPEMAAVKDLRETCLSRMTRKEKRLLVREEGPAKDER